MIKKILICIMILTSASASFSGDYESGLLYGFGHAFMFSSSANMVLDNKAGADQGLHMVFYLRNSKWAESSTIAYSVNYRKSETVKSAEDVANSTVRRFVSNGSKDYHITGRKKLKIDDFKSAEIFHFEGDKWGNYEAVGYFDEKDDINFLVYHSRNKKDFEKYYDDFLGILRSYRNMYQLFRFVSAEEFKQRKKESDSLLEDKKNKEYELKLIESMIKTAGERATYCSEKTGGKNDRLEIIFSINSSGFIDAIFVNENRYAAECFSWPFMVHRFPEHNMKNNFLLHINLFVVTGK